MTDILREGSRTLSMADQLSYGLWKKIENNDEHMQIVT